MAKRISTPICRATSAWINELKSKNDSGSNKYNQASADVLRQTFTKFILWIITDFNPKNFSMDDDGTIRSKDESITFDSFIAANMQNLAETYVAVVSKRMSNSGFNTFLTNLKKALAFIAKNGIATFEVEKLVNPNIRIDYTHPWVEQFLVEETSEAARTQSKYRLKFFFMALMGVDSTGYATFWTTDAIKKENRFIATLAKNSSISELEISDESTDVEPTETVAVSDPADLSSSAV